MEKPGDPEIPLAILHHDERLIFPGYDIMVGKECEGQDDEAQCKAWAIGSIEVDADPAGHGRNSVTDGFYGRRRQLVVAAIIWCAACLLTSCLRSVIRLFTGSCDVAFCFIELLFTQHVSIKHFSLPLLAR